MVMNFPLPCKNITLSKMDFYFILSDANWLDFLKCTEVTKSLNLPQNQASYMMLPLTLRKHSMEVPSVCDLRLHRS